jgi:Tol biopolymer transport system component
MKLFFTLCIQASVSLPALSQTLPVKLIFTDNNTGGREAIFLSSLKDQEEIMLTEGCCPSVSPDGSRIAFVLPRNRGDGSGDIYIYDLHSRKKSRLVSMGNSCTPQWSPDGRKIAFEFYGNKTPEIFIANADGSGQAALIGDARCPSWSPDGKTLAMVRDFDIYLFDMDSKSTKQLTHTEKATETMPRFSPDGRHIAYQHQSDKDANAIYITSMESGENQKVIDYKSDHISWTPAGDILFEKTEEGKPSQVAYVHPETRKISILTNTPRNHYWPLWVAE